jgi:hypothetical protein
MTRMPQDGGGRPSGLTAILEQAAESPTRALRVSSNR